MLGYVAFMISIMYHLKVNYFARVESPPKTGAFRVSDIPELTSKKRLTKITGELDEEGWHVGNSTEFKRFNHGHFPAILGMQAVAKTFRYRTLSVITVGNLKGYGISLMIARSSIMCAMNILLRGPSGSKWIEHQWSPSEWNNTRFDEFSNFNQDIFVDQDGFRFAISDDQTGGMDGLKNNPGKTFYDFKWFRAFKLEIDSIGLKIEGSVVKEQHRNMYTGAHPFSKADRRYWRHSKYMYNLPSSGEFTYEGETVKLHEGGEQVFGDMISEEGIYPFKGSSINIEWNYIDVNGELVSFKVADGGISDPEVNFPRDQVCIGNEWHHLEPTKVSYNENGDPYRIQSHNFEKLDVLKMDVEIKSEETGTGNALNLAVVQADTRAKTAVYNGYWIDRDGVTHTIDNATGFFVYSYIQL